MAYQSHIDLSAHVRKGAVQLLQEAQLFIDAAHDCHNKLRGGAANGVRSDDVAQPSA